MPVMTKTNASQLLIYLDKLEASYTYSTTTYTREVTIVTFSRVLKVHYYDYTNGLYTRRGDTSDYPDVRLKAFLKREKKSYWTRCEFKELIHVASRYDKLKALQGE